MRRSRRVAVAVAVAVAVSGFVAATLAPSPSASAADPALEAQIDRLTEGLGEPDPSVRAKAWKEVVALGPAAIPVLLLRLPKDVKSRRFAGMLDAAAAIDLEGAIAEIESTRSEWKMHGWTAPADGGPEPKARDDNGPKARDDNGPKARDGNGPKAKGDAPPRVVDVMLDTLREKRPAIAKHAAVLAPSQLSEAFVLPPWVSVLLTGKTLPEALAGAAYNWREKDGVLEIDVKRSGSYAQKVTAEAPHVLELGPRKPFRKLVVWKRLGRWFVAPAATWTVGLDALFVEFLDTDLDGDVTGDGDLVRFGGGAFRRIDESDLAWSPSGLIRWHVRKEGTGASAQFVVDWTREPRAPWLNDVQANMMDQVNSWRRQVGMPPQWPDRARSAACNLHYDYWVANGFTGHDEDKGAPKWSAEGARAGRLSSVTNGPDGPDFVRDIEWTLLHRNSCVAHPSEGVGAWSGGTGGLLWGGGQDARDRDFPILVPGPGMDAVPVLCEPEIPIPDKNPDFYKTPRGVPLSVTWSRLGSAWEDLKRLRIELYANGAGEPVPGTIYSKENRYKADFASGFPEDTVFFCADGALEKDTPYVARFRADGKDGPVEFEWEFRTEE